MKNLFLIGFLIAGMLTGQLLAQPPVNNHKEKMKVFADWIGHWKGEGTMQMGPGEPQKTSVDEKIETRLDGTVLIIEGVGKAAETTTGTQKITHHALGLLSYNAYTDQYKFASYLSDGRHTDAWFKVLEQNKFQWGFNTPQGKIRYNIVMNVSEKSWDETGEYSADGNSWTKFFDMHLTRVE